MVYVKLVKYLYVSAAIELLSFPTGQIGFVCLNIAKKTKKGGGIRSNSYSKQKLVIPVINNGCSGM